MTPPERKVTRARAKRNPVRRPPRSHTTDLASESVDKADNLQASTACPRCADELGSMGLPYRIVLRCTHRED